MPGMNGSFRATDFFPRIVLGAFWISLGLGLATALYYSLVEPRNAPWLVIVVFNLICLVGIGLTRLVVRIIDKIENG